MNCPLAVARNIADAILGTDEPADAVASPARLAVDRAVRKLIAAASFHWTLLTLTAFREDATQPTMMVGLDAVGRITLFYNPEFVLSLTEQECCGVLVHEINHLLFEHVAGPPETRNASRRAEDRVAHEATAWLLATECTANEFIAFPLPGEPITIEQLKLMPGESTLQRYAKLRKKAKLPNLSQGCVV